MSILRNVVYPYGESRVVVTFERLLELLDEDQMKFLLAALALKLAETIGEEE